MSKTTTKKDPIPMGVVAKPGGTKVRLTGSWRVQRPQFDSSKCTGCHLCEYSCPDGCVLQLDDKKFDANLDYCKGCGKCAAVCPVHGIEMSVER